jgi:hypothetical protein
MLSIRYFTAYVESFLSHMPKQFLDTNDKKHAKYDLERLELVVLLNYTIMSA